MNKFIKLHNRFGDSVYVSIHNIIAFVPQQDPMATCVIMSGGREFLVRETPEEVKEALSKAKHDALYDAHELRQH